MNNKQMAARTEAVPANVAHTPSLVARMAAKYGVDADKFLGTLKSTAFRGENGKEITNEQLMALLVVAEAHGLNPWLKEIYAFPDKSGGIMPVIGIDGFIKIANTHPQFAGMSFSYDDDGEWIECVIERKDRTTPTRIREYMEECKRNTQPWQQWPRRMLRHRALSQCVRVAFGFAGVMESDEADAYLEGQVKDITPRGKPETAAPRAKQIEAPKPPEVPLDLQLTQLIDSTGVPESEVLARFEAGDPAELTDAQRSEAIHWLRSL